MEVEDEQWWLATFDGTPLGGPEVWLIAVYSGKAVNQLFGVMTELTSLDPPDILIRRATLADVPALARHRVGMFRDMGEVHEREELVLLDASTAFFLTAIESGEYVAWVATTADTQQEIVAGAGMLLRPMLPRPGPSGIIQGLEGLIVNVYTEPPWRRRGIAARLMHHVLDFAQTNHIGRVQLHASNEGRPLYEKLGFVPTAEMRLVRRVEEAPPQRSRS